MLKGLYPRYIFSWMNGCARASLGVDRLLLSNIKTLSSMSRSCVTFFSWSGGRAWFPMSSFNKSRVGLMEVTVTILSCWKKRCCTKKLVNKNKQSFRNPYPFRYSIHFVRKEVIAGIEVTVFERTFSDQFVGELPFQIHKILHHLQNKCALRISNSNHVMTIR